MEKRWIVLTFVNEKVYQGHVQQHDSYELAKECATRIVMQGKCHVAYVYEAVGIAKRTAPPVVFESISSI